MSTFRLRLNEAADREWQKTFKGRRLPLPTNLPVAPAPPQTPPAPSASVIYEEDKVTAYLDDNGRPVAPHFATHAKVWTPDKKDGVTLQIISLTGTEVASA